ncbi:hypothetical protein [Nitrosomonas sp. Nm33]
MPPLSRLESIQFEGEDTETGSGGASTQAKHKPEYAAYCEQSEKNQENTE